MRGRNSGRRNQSSRTQNFESSGPENKVRGNVQQVVEKYLQLARDASVLGDTVTAENYFQHAEHYFRVQAANNSNNDNRQANRPQGNAGNGQETQSKSNGAAEGAPQPAVEMGSEKDSAKPGNGAADSGDPTQDAG